MKLYTIFYVKFTAWNVDLITFYILILIKYKQWKEMMVHT